MGKLDWLWTSRWRREQTIFIEVEMHEVADLCVDYAVHSSKALLIVSITNLLFLFN